ncbi:metal-dependent hydrolase [Lysobacter tyrosinilyticus]
MAHGIQPRKFTAAFSEQTPRHWCGGDAALTHILNTYTLVVPGNEGYYIRSLKLCMPRLSDPAAIDMVMRFLQQEGQHGAGHHRFWAVLEAQGYRFRGFVRGTDAVLYRFLEPITPLPMRLAMVSCVEHVNAYLGHEFLAQRMLEGADPDLRVLFEWHFAEEIEHKHVAYDVMQQLWPSYVLRLLGAALVLPLFYLLMTAGMLYLLHQDRLLTSRSVWRGFGRHLFSGHHMVRRSLAHIGSYLRPGFHPWQLDDSALARGVVEVDRASATPRLRDIPVPAKTESAAHAEPRGMEIEQG